MDSKLPLILFFSALLLVMSGCEDSEKIELLQVEIAQKQARIEELESDLIHLEEEFAVVRSASEELTTEFRELQLAIDDFSDGYSNWRDVVGEVQSEADHVKNKVEELEATIP